MSRNETFLAACRREKTPYTPVWLMRQAGRYLEEYRRLREKTPFLDLCRRPDLAAEITAGAVRRLGVDAAILFSDILLVLEPMGVGLEYTEDNGPVLRRPVRSAADVDALADYDPHERLAFVFEAVRQSRAALADSVPLIGFAGGPFTLASYLIEGGGSRSYARTKSFMYADPGAWGALMERLSGLVSKYLAGQIAAGAQAVQIFDSWVGCLSAEDYRRRVLPYMRDLIGTVGKRVPVIHFSTSTAGILRTLRDAGGDVIGIDWRIDLDVAWKSVGEDFAIQGNLDPAVLLAPVDEIERQTREILRRASGRPGHIFNLGHGVLPQTPVDHVIRLVEVVHESSSRAA
jgi:uroporphyrinogen decarboxylase